jgi:hypothetical protein
MPFKWACIREKAHTGEGLSSVACGVGGPEGRRFPKTRQSVLEALYGMATGVSLQKPSDGSPRSRRPGLIHQTPDPFSPGPGAIAVPDRGDARGLAVSIVIIAFVEFAF